MCRVIMPVAVLVEHGCMGVRMRVFFIDQQERAADHENPSEAIRSRWRFVKNDDGQQHTRQRSGAI